MREARTTPSMASSPHVCGACAKQCRVTHKYDPSWPVIPARAEDERGGMWEQKYNAPEMSATLRLRYWPICSSVILVVKGVETSAMEAIWGCARKRRDVDGTGMERRRSGGGLSMLTRGRAFIGLHLSAGASSFLGVYARRLDRARGCGGQFRPRVPRPHRHP